MPDAPSVDAETPPDDDRLVQLHQRLVAASGVRIETDAAKLENQWMKTIFVANYPDTAVTRMLDSAVSLPEVTFDYSIHLQPQDSASIVAQLEDSIRDLEVKRARKSESGDVTQIRTTKTLEDHTAIYERLLEGSSSVFDVSIYLTVRAGEREAVERAADTLRRSLQGSQLAPAVASYRQADALVSTSPIGQDVLGHSVTMLDGAVGCLFPFSMGTHIEDDGTLLGYCRHPEAVSGAASLRSVAGNRV